MRKLSLIIGWIFLAGLAFAQQNPHGEKLQFSCTDCHTTEGWTFSKETAVFSHDLTDFELEGQHVYADCGDCHSTLVFSEAKSNCIDCHTDMHNNTVGLDCARCHDSRSWIVENITEMHQISRFPLLGAHNTADCSACHTSASTLEFQPLGGECIDCHRQDYQATTNPNHIEAGISTDCIECHKLEAHEWTSAGFNHDFFPLTNGHATDDCAACHTNGLFEPVSTDCFTCHEQDFNAATNPSHQNSGFTTTCTECHTTDPDWKPAKFDIHDAYYFPVYSGSHRGEWDNCLECHTQPENYGVFSCTDCHEHGQSEMNDEHDDVNGYVYSSPACFACHPLGKEEGSFNHEATGFPLKGAHIQTNCLDCHGDGFSSTVSDCSSCHSNDYSQASDPNHVDAGIEQTCETCHNENGWSPSLFDHVVTSGFELTGGHSGRTCSDCHNGTTSNASPECISCHQENYNEAENHLASNYPFDCLQCHNRNTWEDADFDHNNTNFALTGAHIATECAACHTDGYAGTSTLCSSCHTDNYNEAQNPSHTVAGIATDCENCHETSEWVPSNFDHTVTTGFELSGGHSGRTCSDCHQGTTSNASPECISCHQENYNDAENHLASNYPYECLQCHSVNSWEGADFDHNNTNFALTGAHVATECAACHTDSYAGTSTLCSSCHTDNYNEAQNPSHTVAGIATDCENCHETSVWVPSNFDHTVTTGFELAGGHSGRTCSDCHQGTTSNASPECISCHQEDYNDAENHLASNYPFDCLQCHNRNTWEDADFDHNNTNFALTGAHVATECAACHTDSYAGTSTLCSSCHTDNYNEAQNPSHTLAGIATDCENCHETSVWVPSNFDHTVTTGFELAGGHSGRTCSDCHQGTTSNASPECISCHQENYNDAENHLASNYPFDCLQCHNRNTWEDADFDHNNTNFALTGAHIATECTACHTDSYAGTSTLCSSCHTDNYNEAQNPSHTVAGIATDCENCHETTAWVPSSFDHTVTTGFELSGGHSGRTCSDCHQGTTSNASPECISCHQENYNDAENHLASNYPYECLQCHSVNSWEGADFDHNNTNFPLTGAHVATECAACHTDSYAGTSMDCSSCHQADYNQTVNPNHSSLGFAQNCEDCHSTTAGWEPALFPNHNDYYALNGAHATVAENCFLCHEGSYTSTPNTCFNCHTSDYNNTIDPSHSAAQFPTDCQSCHSESAWEPSTFDHDGQYFPIYSGKHRGEWNSCSDCHTQPTNYSVFSCTICHEHNESEMNSEHNDVSGYVYNSANCLACHPNGTEDD